MYIYVVHCPTPISLVWKEFYSDLFKNFQPRYIVQTLANLSKKQTDLGKKRNIPRDLLLRLDDNFSLQFEKINLVLETESSLLLKLKTGHLYESEFEKCAKANDCDGLDHIIKELGNVTC